MLNSSSEIQWTVMVSWEAVQSSSRIDGGFGAVGKGRKEYKEIIHFVLEFYNHHFCCSTQHLVLRF